MKIENLRFTNFRSFESQEIPLNCQSTVIFGVNGTGKSSVLKGINLLYANIINQIVNRKELRQNYNLSLEDIRFGKADTKIAADFYLESEIISYSRSMVRKTGKRNHNVKNLSDIADKFQSKYIGEEDQDNIPVFANYGTNRLVLDIPLRIRTHHEFDIYSAYEKAIENRIDFRTFFEWFRNQEDYENQCKIERNDLKYCDRDLSAVRFAIESMLEGCNNLRVARKPRLEMKVSKQGMNLSVSQLSDGEKCTMALFGDLARRLAIANPKLENPLHGTGVVLIDEIELHMHPTWQRKILGKLREVFPNIQFIVTTHSPLVLSEVDETYKVFYLSTDSGNCTEVRELAHRLDGFDTDYILEEFMGTGSLKESTRSLIHRMYIAIEAKKYDEAQVMLAQLKELTNANNADVLTASMMIKRGRLKSSL